MNIHRNTHNHTNTRWYNHATTGSREFFLAIISMMIKMNSLFFNMILIKNFIVYGNCNHFFTHTEMVRISKNFASKHSILKIILVNLNKIRTCIMFLILGFVGFVPNLYLCLVIFNDFNLTNIKKLSLTFLWPNYLLFSVWQMAYLQLGSHYLRLQTIKIV